jgi:hypothetical protein
MKLIVVDARDDHRNLYRVVQEGEARVRRQIEAIRRLERDGHGTMAYDARSLAIAWKKKLDIARSVLAIEQEAQRNFGQKR